MEGVVEQILNALFFDRRVLFAPERDDHAGRGKIGVDAGAITHWHGKGEVDGFFPVVPLGDFQHHLVLYAQDIVAGIIAHFEFHSGD